MKEFIKVQIIRNAPGNPKCDAMIRARDIHAIGDAPAENAITGGVAFIDVGPNGDCRYIVTNEVSDIVSQIERTEM